MLFGLLLVAMTRRVVADPAAEVVRNKLRNAVGYEAFRKLEHGFLVEDKTDDEGTLAG